MRRFALAVLVASIPFAEGCGSSGSGIHPSSALGTTTEAQHAFADIRVAFVDESRGRTAVRLALERFLDKWPEDGLAPLAHVYLAHALIDLGDDASATKHVSPFVDVRTGAMQPGTAGDLAALALGRTWRRAGKADEAYTLLRSLVGKLLDPWARSVLDAEVTQAALEAKYEYEALAYMDTWLRDVSDEDRDAVRAHIRTMLEKIPRASLEGAFRGMMAQGSAGYGVEVRRLVAERLAHIAVDDNDPRLARWMLDVDGSGQLIPTDVTLALQDVASAKRGELAVAGRSIGLVLPTSKPTIRETAADVARGAAYALGLPRTLPGAADVRLVTKSDAGAMGVALEELAGEGAALVIAGFDSAGANDALAFADRRQVPVITLAMPSAPPGKWAFVLGESDPKQLALLENELRARKITKSGLVLADVQLTSMALEHPLFVPPRGCDFRSGDLAAIRTWTVVAPPSCAQRVQAELARSGGTIVLSLEAVGGVDRPGAGIAVFGIVAGRFPARPEDTELSAYAQRFGGQPNWWTALGRDAAIVGKAAVKGLPVDQTQSPAEVARRREMVRAALEAVTVDLWSTEEHGFQNHVMPRKLRVQSLK